jgi:hypothetical protein
VLKRALVVLSLVGALGPATPAAFADACGVPDTGPVWVDFAGHDAPVPAKPGLVLAVASGTDAPKRLREQGAATVMYDLNFNKRVGTTLKPADPSTIEARAKSLYDYAVTVTGCETPTIAANELFGAQTPTPWSETNAQYRANVLAFLQALSALGARPLLSIANPPFTGGDAAEWWRQVSRVAILLRQVYFTSPNAKALSAMGPVAASRVMRQGMRNLVTKLAQIGIPAGRIALQLQFHSSPGLGARAGLEPAAAWLEIVKLEALAAKQVAKEFKIAGVWSWGWATFNPNVTPDPDKPAAACVWLWARDQSLCDGPAAAGPDFNASLTEGQLTLPLEARCTFADGQIDRKTVARFTTLTGDLDYATSVLFEHAVLNVEQPVERTDVLSAERAVLATSFGGDRKRYWAALAQAKLTIADARAIIVARIQRDLVQARFRPPQPTPKQVADFLATYAEQPVRLVQTTEKAPWLGNTAKGWVVSSLAPAAIFSLEDAGEVDTPDGRFTVTPLGPALPLALVPRAQAEQAARVALERLAREQAYRGWLRAQEQERLETAVCLNDRLPTPSPTDLSPFVPFLLAS